MYHKRTGFLFGLGSLCALSAGASAGVLDGIGLLGDSISDEYQFYTADPGDRSFSRNFVEILSAMRSLNFGQFSDADRGSPRLQGFEYNYARSRATAAANFVLGPGADFTPVTTLNQHTGLASHVAAKEVTLAWLFVGGNDFLQFFVDPAAAATVSPATMTTLVGQMTANVTTAAQTILDADPDVKLVLGTLPNVASVPAARAVLATLPPDQAQALAGLVTQAVVAYNDQLRALDAAHSRIALADVAPLFATVLAQPTFEVGGLTLDTQLPGAGLDHVWLPDGIHPGTVMNGLFANLFLDTVNQNFGAAVTPLSQAEIVSYARSVPEPSTLFAAAAGSLLLRRRRRTA